ncbi:hypothetical protein COLO4_24731 [Corchorus olitorius]|uniref:Helitron helicase-like domain-containing protein n=1 Tax=Corchorus olitorius TaxID=93759 RepID=A0A1R3I7H6_9ROSI|nr:hypothetical protein COLO4_24731 [Corchorus olitorius]
MIYLFVLWTAGSVEYDLSWVYNEDHIRKLFEPHYIGGPTYQCIHCKAWLWYEERIKICSSTTNPVDSLINNSRGPYVFQTLGHNYHYMGTLLPEEGRRPRYAQLYVVDTANECENHISPFVSDVGETIVRPDIVQGIQQMLDEVNEVVKIFRSARDMHELNRTAEIRIRLVNDRDKRNRVYNLPIASEIGGLIVGDFGQSTRVEISLSNTVIDVLKELLNIILCLCHYNILYYSHMEKTDIILKFLISNTGIQRTIHSFMVGVYSSNSVWMLILLSETRGYVILKKEQELFRVDGVQSVRDAVAQGDLRGDSVGQRIVLPASFTGSPRYMFQNYQDSLAICSGLKYKKLSEIFRGQKAEDRPDIVCRVFRIKLKSLIDDLTKNKHFGEAVAISYTIEYQKRGLPHAHILLWLKDQNNVICGPEIDKIISAEIPDKVKDPEGFNAVANYMMHGPCGLAFPRASCMEEGRCKKRFPKAYQEFSTSDDDGFPLYRRRKTDASVLINDIALDNSQSRAIKYLFKYINKGPDRASVVFETTTQNPRDEIKQFVDCRYLSPHEACWRLFEFEIHHREPAVQRLPIHLRTEQDIYFHDTDSLDDVINRTSNKVTMFTKWMEVN